MNYLVEGLEFLLCDSDLCVDPLELDLEVLEVHLEAVAHLLGRGHLAVQTVDAVLSLVDAGLTKKKRKKSLKDVKITEPRT